MSGFLVHVTDGGEDLIVDQGCLDLVAEVQAASTWGDVRSAVEDLSDHDPEDLLGDEHDDADHFELTDLPCWPSCWWLDLRSSTVRVYGDYLDEHWGELTDLIVEEQTVDGETYLRMDPVRLDEAVRLLPDGLLKETA